ncbi:MAG: hypothetical protein QXR69_00215 [Conexivisphaerales archaeon]
MTTRDSIKPSRIFVSLLAVVSVLWIAVGLEESIKGSHNGVIILLSGSLFLLVAAIGVIVQRFLY